jgi:uncharacterized membrane protein YjdF
MNQMLRRFEPVIVSVLFLAGVAFLLKMCYLSLLFNTIFGIIFLLAFYTYIKKRYEIRLPPVLLVLVFAALQVDALGNYFRMYGRSFGPVHYDEFAHLMVQALAAPLIIWLLRAGLEMCGYRLPFGLITLFAITTLFSLTAFYEIIELWDELYFGGQRIWSPHDAPNDLQWNFAGILLGALLTYLIARARVRASSLVAGS